MTYKILGVSGSLRRDSFNTALLRAAAQELPADAELEIWTGLESVPPFSEDAESAPAPAAVADLRSAIDAADALLIATPEYNGSIPGQLKNALDWASRPRGAAALQDKPAGVTGASPSPNGAAWAQSDLRRILNIAGANVAATELPVPRAYQQFDAQGRLADTALRGRLAALAAELIALIPARAASRTPATC
jgi:chromate reductase